MKERVASLKGEFEMKSSAEEGTVVKVSIPLKATNKRSKR
jgi:signal transduction histidine kinase